MENTAHSPPSGPPGSQCGMREGQEPASPAAAQRHAAACQPERPLLPTDCWQAPPKPSQTTLPRSVFTKSTKRKLF